MIKNTRCSLFINWVLAEPCCILAFCLFLCLQTKKDKHSSQNKRKGKFVNKDFWQGRSGVWGHLSGGALEYRESNLALCHPLLSVAPEREGYFREQQTVNLLCWHAGLPENIYPGMFCGGDILSACTLLLVWIYFLKKKKKKVKLTRSFSCFFAFLYLCLVSVHIHVRNSTLK